MAEPPFTPFTILERSCAWSSGEALLQCSSCAAFGNLSAANLGPSQSGPLVAVTLCAPREVTSSVPPIDTLAGIDTGVLTTRIQEGVATSLGLEPNGTINIMTATRPVYKVYQYRIRIAFPEGNMAFEVDAIEVPYMVRPHARIKCLIGRDILKCPYEFYFLLQTLKAGAISFDTFIERATAWATLRAAHNRQH